MRVCIVGPMRGLPGHNFAAFDVAATRWREAGHAVYNPAEADRAVGFDGTTEPLRGFVDAAICRDIEEYIRADALAVLPRWEGSRLAPVEVALVRALDPPRLIFDAITMQPLEMSGATIAPTGVVSAEDQDDIDAAWEAPRKPGSTPWKHAMSDIACDLDAEGFPVANASLASILVEADSLVNGPRRRAYGHPREDYGRAAKMFAAILGVDVTPSQAILCMVAVKISRECHRPARDNRVDIAGYAKCLDLVAEDGG